LPEQQLNRSQDRSRRGNRLAAIFLGNNTAQKPIDKHREGTLADAVGVSGSPGAEKDEACANAGIQKLADKLK
jgi:hypothetical protein